MYEYQTSLSLPKYDMLSRAATIKLLGGKVKGEIWIKSIGYTLLWVFPVELNEHQQVNLGLTVFKGKSNE